MPPTRSKSSRSADVLVLDADQAEWLCSRDRERATLGACDIAGQATVDFARAALAARGHAGSTARHAILALGPGLASVRLIQVPELSRRNLSAVLKRKAAAIAGCDPEDVVYAAARCGVDVDASADGNARVRWAVAAMRRSRLRGILLALKRSGISVPRVVASHLSIPTRGYEIAGRGDDACIAIGVDRRSVHVALIGSGALVMQNTLEGNFHRQPTLALGLLQEVRTIEGYWRKHSRGGQVGRIVLIGLQGDRAQLLATALATAIPGARILREDAAVHDDPEVAGRIEILACARTSGGFQVELALPVPAPPAATAAVAGSFLLCVGVAGTVGYESTHGRELEMRAELQRLSVAGVGLDGLLEREAEARAKLGALGALTERNAAVLRDGWPLPEILADCLTACGHDAALLSLRAGRWDRAREIDLEAITSARPFAAMQHIASVRAKLDASPILSIESEEARGVPNAGHAGFVFAFGARAEDRP